MSLYASVCNNTVVIWPFFIELIVSFCVKITQGKLRENTGNFILARMWPPCGMLIATKHLHSDLVEWAKCDHFRYLHTTKHYHNLNSS